MCLCVCACSINRSWNVEETVDVNIRCRDFDPFPFLLVDAQFREVSVHGFFVSRLCVYDEI